MSDAEKSCAACRHYSPGSHHTWNGQEVGECRFSPPVADIGESTSYGYARGAWPIIEPDDWCSAFESSSDKEASSA